MCAERTHTRDTSKFTPVPVQDVAPARAQRRERMSHRTQTAERGVPRFMHGLLPCLLMEELGRKLAPRTRTQITLSQASLSVSL